MLLPKKSFKYDKFDLCLSNNYLNNSSGSLKANSVSNMNSDNLSRENYGANGNMLTLRDNAYPVFYLNDSIISSMSASSYFNRTIIDKKREKSLNLFLTKVVPILFKYIKDEIFLKYDRIYEFISTPLKNNFRGIIIALELQSGDLIKENYRKISAKEEIQKIFDKQKILKLINGINKEIRFNDNISYDNYYDNLLNEAIIDCAIEIIKKERLYHEEGEPLPWGSRMHEVTYKYDKKRPKQFVDNIIQQLYTILHTKLGLITSNYDYLTKEQINEEKERRLIKNLKNELIEQEENWNNLEIEETQLKIEVTEIINDQLYNEVMEILEHISLSRKKPELYQYKSIFVCEDIPKLSFQISTNENKNSIYSLEDNDLINFQ